MTENEVEPVTDAGVAATDVPSASVVPYWKYASPIIDDMFVVAFMVMLPPLHETCPVLVP